MKLNVIIGLQILIIAALSVAVLDRGIRYSTTRSERGVVATQTCHYFSLRGFFDKAALGGLKDIPGFNLIKKPMHCPLIASDVQEPAESR